MSAEPTAAPGPTTWSAWEDALVVAVRALPDEGALVVVAPEGHTRMARRAGAGMFGRLLGGRKSPVSPWARLVRAEDLLRGHWIGAAALGGTFPWSPGEVDTLLAGGWHRPSAGDGEDFVRFWPDDVPSGPYLPEADARRAARALADTFRDVLDVTEDDLPALRPA